MMDTAAMGLAWFVICVVPIGGIVLFWMVHVLPEKIAHKRHHPQRDAIQTLCLLSLVFGGLLWPLAWLWAYTKPVAYRGAYGTEKHDDYFHEMGEKAQEGELLEHELAHLREELDAMAAKGTLTAELKVLRKDLAAAQAASAAPAATRRPRPRGRREGRGRLMEALLLAIYSFFVWLIFIKFKWLPWNTTSQVTVVIIPIVALAALILTLNVVAPSSADVRVIKYVVQVIPQVRGRVIEVPVEPNRLVKKGELLFRIDPTPYQNDLNVAKAKLAADEAKLAQAGAGLVDASAGARQLQEQLKSASGQVSALQPRLELARLRVRQNRELVATGAGDRFALEQAEANVIELEGQIATAAANEAQVAQKLSGQVNGEQASVAAARAQLATAKAQVDLTRADLANAQWNLDQTAVYAPASGYAINVQLRPGSYVTAFPVAPAMSFVEENYQVIALYAQNELPLVEPGNPAEFTLKTYPGRIIKAKVDSIVWAQGQGQVAQSGMLPQTGAYPQVPGRFPVKFDVAERDRELFLAAGADGAGAIYTEHAHAIHILRMVILRVGSITDYLVLKLH